MTGYAAFCEVLGAKVGRSSRVDRGIGKEDHVGVLLGCTRKSTTHNSPLTSAASVPLYPSQGPSGKFQL